MCVHLWVVGFFLETVSAILVFDLGGFGVVLGLVFGFFFHVTYETQ